MKKITPIIFLILCLGYSMNFYAQSCRTIIFPHCPGQDSEQQLISPPNSYAKSSNAACGDSIQISIPPEYGTVTYIGSDTNGNIEDTILGLNFLYETNTNCFLIDSFEIMIYNDTNSFFCDTVMYMLHLEFQCETPDDLFCCIAPSIPTYLNILANDSIFIEENYDFSDYEIEVTGQVVRPSNGSALGLNDPIYTPSPTFTRIDSFSYTVEYTIITTDGDTITICDEQTCYVFVEDCLNTMKDELCVAIGDTICVEPLANDIVEPTINHPILETLECQNPLPVIDSLVIFPQPSAPLLFSDGTCVNAFSDSVIGASYTYLYDVYTDVGGHETDSIVITVKTCRERDSLALVALYNSTNGANWTNTWDLSQPISTWYGITLNADSCVTCIDMGGANLCSFNDSSNGNNLSGTIPIQIGNLDNLEILILAQNQLTDTIPSQLGNLNNLTMLNLTNNQLNGNIPSELGGLNNLTHLGLGSNQLSGITPPEFGDLDNLMVLNMSHNQLSGSIPSGLGSLNNLIRLIYYSNQLSGNIPPELGNLDNLTILNLSINELSDTIPSQLGNLNSLTQLTLGSNQLSGGIPMALGNLNNLTDLKLHSNQLSGSIPGELGDLSDLTILKLYSNQLSGCYDENLMNLCSQLSANSNSNISISDGNNFDATWEEFCSDESGACCISDDNISGDISNGTYQAAQTITSSGQISSGENINFRAGELIHLDTGFTVLPNADFSGEIEDCTPQ